MVVLQTIVRAFQRHPLVGNCAAYATFSASAELIQQHFEVKAESSKKVPKQNFQWQFSTYCLLRFSLPQEYDIKALGRFGILGGFILGPSLYAWYHLLDAFLPGSSKSVIAIKIVADTFCLGKSFLQTNGPKSIRSITHLLFDFTGIPYCATYYTGECGCFLPAMVFKQAYSPNILCNVKPRRSNTRKLIPNNVHFCFCPHSSL